MDNPVTHTEPNESKLRIYNINELEEVANNILEWRQKYDLEEEIYRPVYPIFVSDQAEAELVSQKMLDEYGIYSRILKYENGQFFVACGVAVLEN